MIKVGDYKITRKDKEEVMKVLKSGRLSEGKKVREFEEKWADFIGTKYCVIVNSGTSALIASLLALKDERLSKNVLTSPLTYISTVNAIVLAGLNPVFSDVSKEDFNIIPDNNYSYDSIFIPVHLFGYPVDLDKFKFLFTIEDACEAHGTIYKGKKVGSIGDLGCFSFYIAHNIQVGEMGAITTNNLSLYLELKKIKANGRVCACGVCLRGIGKCPYKNNISDPRFTHSRIGYNFKTGEIQAVLALNQLEHAEEIIKQRQSNVKYLNKYLKTVSCLQLPKFDENVSYLAYPIIVKENSKIKKQTLCRMLEERGIETRPLFSCIPTQQPAYNYIKKDWEGKLPNAEWLSNNGFYIGCHQYLTKDNLDCIIETLSKILK